MLRHSTTGFTEIAALPAGTAAAKHQRVALRKIGRAIAQDSLCLVYQPIVKAGNHQFPALFECLLRIEEPSGRLASAGPFLSHIEHHDMGRVVDRMVLRRALKALRAHPMCRLSINLSANSLNDAEWMDLLISASLGESPVTDRLIIEITETAELSATDANLSFFDRVRGMGCSVALDDFGAGYTPLSHLRDFQFDMLKIDGSFVRGLKKHACNRFLVQKMIEMAQHFDLMTIAEWVETQEEATLLQDMGADCLQGHFFGAPMRHLPKGTQSSTANSASL